MAPGVRDFTHAWRGRARPFPVDVPESRRERAKAARRERAKAARRHARRASAGWASASRREFKPRSSGQLGLPRLDLRQNKPAARWTHHVKNDFLHFLQNDFSIFFENNFSPHEQRQKAI
jgi:hypothetical protein